MKIDWRCKISVSLEELSTARGPLFWEGVRRRYGGGLYSPPPEVGQVLFDWQDLWAGLGQYHPEVPICYTKVEYSKQEMIEGFSKCLKNPCAEVELSFAQASQSIAQIVKEFQKATKALAGLSFDTVRKSDP